MKMHTLWLTAAQKVWVEQGVIDAPRFEQVVCVDVARALECLRAPGAMGDTTWLWHVGTSGPTPDELRQALLGGRQNLWVLALLPEARRLEAAAWLSAGVDRCLPWPCQPALLAAMLRAMRRRADPWGSRVSQWGTLHFDHEAMTLFCEGSRIPLTQREAEVMSLLIRRVGQWVTNQDILMHMCRGLPGVLRPATVQLYVHRINRKIAPHGLHVDCVKRVGYGLGVRPPAPHPESGPAASKAPVAKAHRPFASAWVQAEQGGLSP